MAKLSWCMVIFNTITFISEDLAQIRRGNDKRSAYMEELARDTKLTGTAENIIKNIFARSSMACAMACIATINCQSINYKELVSLTIEKNCQLLDISHSNTSAALEYAASWIHYGPVSLYYRPDSIVESSSIEPTKRSCPHAEAYKCFVNCNSAGLHPDPENCNMFVQCDGIGNSFLMTCPAGTAWDQTACTCLHSFLVSNCGSYYLENAYNPC